MNDAAVIGNLLTSPSVAFAELRERPRFLFPLLLLVASGIAVLVWYTSMVDVAWAADQAVQAMQNLNDEQRSRIASRMTRTSMMISGVVGQAVAIPLAIAVQALYFFIAGKVAGISLSYRHWFTMIVWCGLPVLLGIGATAVLLATESSPLQISQQQLQVLSLNELFFHIPLAGKGSLLLTSLSLVTPLTWTLLTICVKTWSGKSWLSSATFALLPSVVIYGAWAYFAFK